nr:mannosyl-oligosaccharide 1,2-alpha-mannosidase [Kwoniella pini CBS 10737]OCF52665.1 mannosyl-oligosaccharide 1,2-alpha-mannosidase [Kwoniella pini CBS 10737]
MPYTPAYNPDIEKGLSSPTKFAKRFISRKSRWIIGGLILTGTFIFIYSGPALTRPPPPPPHHQQQNEGLPPGHHRPVAGKPGWSPFDQHDEYDDEEEEEDDEYELDEDEDEYEEGSGGWKEWLPFGKGKNNNNKEKSKPILDFEDTNLENQIDSEENQTNEYEFIIDENGDHYITNYIQDIAPLHPDLSKLIPANEMFDEIDLKETTIPVEEIYPNDQLRSIITPNHQDTPEEIRNEIPEGSWAKWWDSNRKLEDWKGQKGEIKKVQWSGFAGGRDRWENSKQRKIREERRDAVKRGFKHAWDAYKRHAWGHDEVRPVSETPSDPFNGWGATIVDSLDTLLLMGFSDEYNLCRPHVNQLNFHWVNGRDWHSTYVTEDEEGKGEVYAVPRDKGVGLAVFETGIRYLGGLIGAYDLSGDDLLIERAEDLANVLGKAFNTVSGLPAGRMDPGIPSNELIHLSTVSIAEVGSMSLELIRLSQITNNRTWFDLAQRAMEYLEERVIPRTSQSPLIPMWFQPDTSIEIVQNGGYAFGGLADSYYEYLIKTFKLLGNNQASQIWKRIYENSIDKASELLYIDINDLIPNRELFTIGKFENGKLIKELEHLTCFSGAMLGLGSKLLDRPKDLIDAEKLTKTCYWLSADTPTGLQPEVVEWFDSNLQSDKEWMYENVTLNSGGNEIYKPPITKEELKFYGDEIKGTHRDLNGNLRWSKDGKLVKTREKFEKPIKYYSKLKGKPTGIKKVNGRGINRPETIESIFYMYRLTGNRKWQEKGWKMFNSWMKNSKVKGGISGLQDVTKKISSENENEKEKNFNDNMESFTLAETFKYHFLLQSEPNLLSLDDYVLNTEAHPLLVNSKLNPKSNLKNSHVKFWIPNLKQNQHLGIRSQGTNVQKFKRLEVLERLTGSRKNGKPIIQAFGQGSGSDSGGGGGGGGRGMGGGGGKPGDRPKPPPGFGMKKVKAPNANEGGGEFPDDF